MSQQTPRRLSLRRKRQATDVNANPKRKSPCNEEDKKSKDTFLKEKKPTGNERTIKLNNNRTQIKESHNVPSPITSNKLTCSTPSISSPSVMKTPRSGKLSSKKNSASRLQSMQQQKESYGFLSPDSPFMSSQLPGTQDCEVVWEDNSPGIDINKLKRSSVSTNGASSKTPSPVSVATAPNRSLFRPQNGQRHKKAPIYSSLSEELDILMTKVNSQENTQSSQDLDISETLGLTALKGSQPFKVTDSTEKTLRCISLEDRKPEQSLKGFALSNSRRCSRLEESTEDDDDDDLFNDSVLKATQHLEEQLLNSPFLPPTALRPKQSPAENKIKSQNTTSSPIIGKHPDKISPLSLHKKENKTPNEGRRPVARSTFQLRSGASKPFIPSSTNSFQGNKTPTSIRRNLSQESFDLEPSKRDSLDFSSLTEEDDDDELFASLIPFVDKEEETPTLTECLRSQGVPNLKRPNSFPTTNNNSTSWKNPKDFKPPGPTTSFPKPSFQSQTQPPKFKSNCSNFKQPQEAKSSLLSVSQSSKRKSFHLPPKVNQTQPTQDDTCDSDDDLFDDVTFNDDDDFFNDDVLEEITMIESQALTSPKTTMNQTTNSSSSKSNFQSQSVTSTKPGCNFGFKSTTGSQINSSSSLRNLPGVAQMKPSGFQRNNSGSASNSVQSNVPGGSHNNHCGIQNNNSGGFQVNHNVQNKRIPSTGSIQRNNSGGFHINHNGAQTHSIGFQNNSSGGSHTKPSGQQNQSNGLQRNISGGFHVNHNVVQNKPSSIQRNNSGGSHMKPSGQQNHASGLQRNNSGGFHGNHNGAQTHSIGFHNNSSGGSHMKPSGQQNHASGLQRNNSGGFLGNHNGAQTHSISFQNNSSGGSHMKPSGQQNHASGLRRNNSGGFPTNPSGLPSKPSTSLPLNSGVPTCQPKRVFSWDKSPPPVNDKKPLSTSQQMKCSQDEIARKKEEALKKRKAKQANSSSLPLNFRPLRK